MRLAFSIVYNALHHLEHNDYANRILSMVDHWAVVYGPAKNTGSTSWCQAGIENWPDDGTLRFLCNLVSGNSKMGLTSFIKPVNKDVMVNDAVDRLRSAIILADQPVFLWEIDIDEQWTAEQMAQAEGMLLVLGASCGQFLCNCHVGPGLLAKGEWGEGTRLPYRRLWLWRGQHFKTHEPPELVEGNGVTVTLPLRFEHYSYEFEKDILFKQAFYGYTNLHEKWLSLQAETNFPQPISRLLPPGYWANTQTHIHKA